MYPGKITQVSFKLYYWLCESYKSPNQTRRITKYAEIEDEDVQEINQKMKEPISGKNSI